ncbi:uncharacterized protein LOC113107107 [Carassius auratus]|uniref:Uncharacterized protein LOC113107107 n=1 Tax=Carassius auratus TaxID=7957 RepID=A0A6P6PU79_CARAU|nr:uncharacterized protein LOC113107107 [Carassius auratus]
MSPPFFPAEEEKALSILGTSASDGISGGTDIHGGVGITQPEPESGPSCSEEPLVSSAISEHLPSPSPPKNPPRTQPPSSVVQTAATTTQQFENVCSCSQDLVQLEREKLDVLKDIRQCLQEANERDNNFQQQLIELKKAKLALEERRVALEEMSFARPSNSVPIILPEDTGRKMKRWRRRMWRTKMAWDHMANQEMPNTWLIFLHVSKSLTDFFEFIPILPSP